MDTTTAKANSAAEAWFKKLLGIGGMAVNGPNPWDPQIHNPKIYNRVRWQGTLGLGESYMDGWWDCAQLDEFFYRLLKNDVEKHIGLSLPVIAGAAKAWLLNLQNTKRVFEVGERHYDLGNDLFEAMLGKTMAYTCAYYKTATDLDSAQIAKFELVCQKLQLRPGMTVLDVGCGWGGLAKYMAENYGVKVIGLTISKEQAEYGNRWVRGLPVEIRLEDYRSFNEPVDRAVAVGLWEHIGAKNHRTAMEVIRRCLPDDGLFLLHSNGSSRSGVTIEPWTRKYIFPNALVPSLKQIAQSAEGLFIIEDVHNFSAYYDKTLMAWHKNFEAAWPKLQHNYDNRFYRMWRYYLLSCAGTFRARGIQLFQIVLSPKGVPGGYQSVR